ncbi:hypothetical protein [Allokutzneria sp. A3M-2-11 16]|uniref:Orn/Lys/Arg family decarboxylase n=1 Tax=Allokutzneria sp. A3M-2-11 16 TaxID=2962043 RepID=UPI0027E2DA29|nr:hypothetical protein [Allokutzneria sp. A3M-2-11 16]
MAAARAVVQRADDQPMAKPTDLPDPGELELEQALSPRDAFFGPAGHVDADKAVGRIAAETISPYQPGVPAILPGEVITRPIRTSGQSASPPADAAHPKTRRTPEGFR